MVILGVPEHTLFRFHDRSYRWIDVKRFPWDGVGDDRSVLEALIGSPHYRDTYLSADPHLADGTVHGPYRVDRISPEDFEHLSETDARAVVEEFRTLYQPPAAELIRTMDSITQPLLHRSTCYRLRPVEDAEHDVSLILEEFRELVSVSRARAEVALIVMAID